MRSLSWPATSATFEVTEEVIEVALEKNVETPFVGEVGAEMFDLEDCFTGSTADCWLLPLA